MNKIKTAELTGAALDWAVSKAEGVDVTHLYAWDYSRNKFSTDWAQGGPIIEREHITTSYAYWGEWESWDDKTMPPPRYKGSTPLIAAMRCYVASKLGDTIEIPAELLTN